MNPEEIVRQYVLQLLTSTFGYSSSDIAIEFPIRLGSSSKRADIVVFYPSEAHVQSNIYIVVECKRVDVRDDGEAYLQLESYLSACVNAKYGVVATCRWRVVEKVLQKSRYVFRTIPKLIDSSGRYPNINYNVSEWHEKMWAAPESKGRNIRQEGSCLVNAIVLILLCYGCVSVLRPGNPDNSNSATRIAATQTGITRWRSNATSTPAPTTQEPGLPATASETATGRRLLPTSALTPVSSNAPAATSTISPQNPNDGMAAPQRGISSRQSSATAIPATGTQVPVPTWTVSPVSSRVRAATSTPSRVGVIQSRQNVNLRQSADIDSAVLRSIPTGTTVVIISENRDGSWLQVRLQSGETGWVASYLVEIQ